jgi:hypothetical protein
VFVRRVRGVKSGFDAAALDASQRKAGNLPAFAICRLLQSCYGVTCVEPIVVLLVAADVVTVTVATTVGFGLAGCV